MCHFCTLCYKHRINDISQQCIAHCQPVCKVSPQALQVSAKSAEISCFTHYQYHAAMCSKYAHTPTKHNHEAPLITLNLKAHNMIIYLFWVPTETECLKATRAHSEICQSLSLEHWHYFIWNLFSSLDQSWSASYILQRMSRIIGNVQHLALTFALQMIGNFDSTFHPSFFIAGAISLSSLIAWTKTFLNYTRDELSLKAHNIIF